MDEWQKPAASGGFCSFCSLNRVRFFFQRTHNKPLQEKQWAESLGKKATTIFYQSQVKKERASQAETYIGIFPSGSGETLQGMLREGKM